MEKILVGIEPKMTGLWPVIYALNLAKRMEVRLYILLVENSEAAREQQEDSGDEPSLKSRLEDLILKGRSEGLSIDYYITGGSFTDELIRFIQEEKISLLVVGYAIKDKKKRLRNIPELLKEIKLRTNCRIEVVQQKIDNTGKKRS